MYYIFLPTSTPKGYGMLSQIEFGEVFKNKTCQKLFETLMETWEQTQTGKILQLEVIKHFWNISKGISEIK